MIRKIGVVGNRIGYTSGEVKAKLMELGVTKEDIIISGGAEGVDTYAQEYAQQYGLTIIIHYPDPDKPSPKRYFDRNFDIASDCEWIIAFDKGSAHGSGTQNTINHAVKLGKKITIIR